MKATKRSLLMALLPLSAAPGAWADYKADIGYAALQAELGAATPTGARVRVIQAEASTVGVADAGYPIYAPDTTLAAFSGKTFRFPGTPSNSASSHATGVGQLFYGNSSLAFGVTDITSYEANDWLNSLTSASGAAARVSSRIANHSWVGKADTAADTGTLLRWVDRQVQRHEYIQVVGMANGASNSPLLGSAYNVIAVGRSDGMHDRGSDAVDAVYAAGRTRPDIVAPQGTTSAATPIVAAAAALLVQAGHRGGTNLSRGASYFSGIGTVYNAERSETVRAILMAGADRNTRNTSTRANLVDYRSATHQTANGLDDRFGAGQVNVYRSYHILAGGEQNSLQDGGKNGAIGTDGFDYDAAFGGAYGSNRTATYSFNAPTDSTLTATLAWNLGVSNNASLSVTRYNLDLALYDRTTRSLVARSASTLDNTENLWVRLSGGHQYELRVTTPEAARFSWDYALAWHRDPVPSAP